MATFLGSTIYILGVFVAALCCAGSGVVIIVQMGESPLFASVTALSMALLSFGFGWSGRRLLQGRT